MKIPVLSGFRASFSAGDMLAKFGGRLAEDAFEHAIELGERLKADVVGDFADSSVGIQKLGPCVLKPDARNVVGEFQSR